MALSETAVSTLLVASVTGEGLVLAVYALITSISDKIIDTRRELIAENTKKFNQAMEDYKTSKTDANLKLVNKSHNRLKNLYSFPSIFSYGMMFTFAFYIISSTLCFIWFATQEYSALFSLPLSASQQNVTEISAMAFFYLATGTFFGVGSFTIVEVATVLKRKWKVLEEEKAKVEKTSSEELEKLRKDIEELKEKEDRRVSV